MASAVWGALRFTDLQELTDKDISPHGKSALGFDVDVSWVHAESKHFVYHFTTYRDIGDPYPAEAESNYQCIKDLFKISKDDWVKKVHIFVFEKESQWKKFGERIRLENPTVQGFTSGWELFLKNPPSDTARVRLVAHELTHIILFRFLDGVPPLCLNEGFSDYVSYWAVGQKAGRDHTAIALVRPVPKDRLIPLAKLTQADKYPEATSEIETFYVESEALVRYLIRQYGGEKFYQIIRACAKGKPFQESFESSTGARYRQLEEAFFRHVTGSAK